MKKILLILLTIFFITGCGQNKQVKCGYYYEKSNIRVENSYIIYFDTLDNLEKIEYLTYINESSVSDLKIENWCSYIMEDYTEKFKNTIECTSTKKAEKIIVKMSFYPDSFSFEEFDTYFGNIDNKKIYTYESIKETIENDELKKEMCILDINEQEKSINHNFNESLVKRIIEDKIGLEKNTDEKLEDANDTLND